MSGGGRVLVVGVGGIGAPCAWALADAGVGPLRLCDPDRVETSNLPRQVLFGPDDVGRPKAEVAAARLAREGLAVEPVVAAFDASTADALLGDVEVVVDATDGAATKDLVHALAVAAGRPVVHAAGIGSEGRVLDVPAGGRPCLACLFGRLAAGDEGGDTCARFGVFPGVVGAVGALAAGVAARRRRAPRAPSEGLLVLDAGAGRVRTLHVEADPACPVCGAGADPRAAVRPGRAERAVAAPRAPAPPDALDLRDEACPMNLLRARRAVERLAARDTLSVWLGEEGASTVPDGLVALGHDVLEQVAEGDGVRVVVRRGVRAAGADDASDAWLRRYARQIVLAELGEGGQRRLGAATARVVGTGDVALAAAVHLNAAGFGAVELDDGSPIPVAGPPWPLREAPGATTRGEALARALLARGAVARAVADASPPTPRVAVVLEGPVAARLEVEPSPDGPRARALGALLCDAAMRAVLRLPGGLLSLPTSR
ncbi:MAG: ThiF family adenylyltransferase [Planctomycetes bacterium]|nr:ThiF family adenylyltransferase [Planctomycetota bacterium]